MFRLSIDGSVFSVAPDSVEKGKKKINNCIAKKSKFFIRDNERRVRKGKDKIFILVKES